VAIHASIALCSGWGRAGIAASGARRYPAAPQGDAAAHRPRRRGCVPPETPGGEHPAARGVISQVTFAGRPVPVALRSIPFLLIVMPAIAGGQARAGDPPVPSAYTPPAGMCRIWVQGVPADKQPAPTDCPTAMRNNPPNGRVIFGPTKDSSRSGGLSGLLRPKALPLPAKLAPKPRDSAPRRDSTVRRDTTIRRDSTA